MPYSPADDAVGLFPDSRQATHCWNDDPAPPPVLVTVPELVELLELAGAPSLAAGCAAAEDPSSDVAGADGAGVAADTDGPGMGVTPERPSGTFTFWST